MAGSKDEEHKRDDVLKRMLETPHPPHKQDKAKSEKKDEKGKKPAEFRQG